MTRKSKIVTGLLALFLGGFGAHRFYLGQPKVAFWYIAGLFMFGISVLVGFVEGVRYLLMSDAKFLDAQLKQVAQVEREPLTHSFEIEPEQPTPLAKVETEKFDLFLYEKELRIIRRSYATTFKQMLDTSINNADEGELTVDLNLISGVKVTRASDDKMSFGFFSGRLAFITQLDTVNQRLGTRFQGELEFDFTKSSEAGVRAFVLAFEAQREEVRASMQQKPAVSASRSFSDELKEIAELRSSGLLTEEEFSRAKKKFLEG
jgi:TM2 domain-containing membrane protein YozV